MRYFYFLYIELEKNNFKIGWKLIPSEKFPSEKYIINKIKENKNKNHYENIIIVNWKEFKTEEDALNFIGA